MNAETVLAPSGEVTSPPNEDIEVQAIAGNILTKYRMNGAIFATFCKGAIGFLSAPPPPDAPPEVKAKAAMMKVGVKGLFIGFGSLIQTFLYGDEKGHPKPGKHDDLIDWYAQAFAMKAVEWAMKNTIVLKGDQEGNGICRVTEFYTKSNTAKDCSIDS